MSLADTGAAPPRGPPAMVSSLPAGSRCDRPDPNTVDARLVSPVKHVTCPQCGTRVVWAPESKYRPFCSERCKLIDLGAWASEAYRVPVEEGVTQEAESPSANYL